MRFAVAFTVISSLASSLFAFSTSQYSDRDIHHAAKVERRINARLAEAETLYDAHLQATSQAHKLLARAALAYPEAFPFPEPALGDICKKYHANQDSYFALQGKYKKDDLKQAGEILKAARAVLDGRKAARACVIKEGGKPDKNHDNEISTWDANVKKWTNTVNAIKQKELTAKKEKERAGKKGKRSVNQ